jgi:hypothetical protein
MLILRILWTALRVILVAGTLATLSFLAVLSPMLVIIFAMFAGFTAWLAKERGRSAMNWWLISCVISPLFAIIGLLLAPDSITTKAQENRLKLRNMRLCPQCAEPVKIEALKCRHCGSEI